jgi:TonB family protein
MAELLWSPQDQVGHASWGFAQQSRIGRFLGLSAAAHVVVAAVSPWLLLTFALSGREEQLLIRTVDFFPPPETAPLGPSPETRGRAGGGSPPPKAAVRKAPVTPAAPPAPAPPAEPAPASPPAPAPEPPAPTGPSGPRDLPAVPTDPRGAAPLPYATRPPVPPAPAAPGGGEAGQAAAMARELAGRGEAGPRATVDLPRDLVRGGGAGSGAGGTGLGAGTGSGEGSGRAASGPGSGLIDTRDPDFSEYFRVIEARVRAAWQYPENLGGTTQTVKLGFSLRLDGAVGDVRVVSSTSGILNDSALAAVRKAAPFPPLPAKFRSLVGQPLVMSFTVTIK